MKREFKLHKPEKKERTIRFERLSRVKRRKKSSIPLIIGIIVMSFLLYNLNSIVKNFTSGLSFFSN